MSVSDTSRMYLKKRIGNIFQLQKVACTSNACGTCDKKDRVKLEAIMDIF